MTMPGSPCRRPPVMPAICSRVRLIMKWWGELECVRPSPCAPPVGHRDNDPPQRSPATSHIPGLPPEPYRQRRSEERRVGKERTAGVGPDQLREALVNDEEQ